MKAVPEWGRPPPAAAGEEAETQPLAASGASGSGGTGHRHNLFFGDRLLLLGNLVILLCL